MAVVVRRWGESSFGRGVLFFRRGKRSKKKEKSCSWGKRRTAVFPHLAPRGKNSKGSRFPSREEGVKSRSICSCQGERGREKRGTGWRISTTRPRTERARVCEKRGEEIAALKRGKESSCPPETDSSHGRGGEKGGLICPREKKGGEGGELVAVHDIVMGDEKHVVSAATQEKRKGTPTHDLDLPVGGGRGGKRATFYAAGGRQGRIGRADWKGKRVLPVPVRRFRGGGEKKKEERKNFHRLGGGKS